MGGLIFTGLSPFVTFTLAAGGCAALLVLYLLRERMRRLTVAFVPLWDSSPGKRQRERLGRQLRRLLSLLLQLVLLFLLLIAAADPQPSALAAGGRTLLLLIDRSASMGAREGDRTRLLQARERARAL